MGSSGGEGKPSDDVLRCGSTSAADAAVADDDDGVAAVVWLRQTWQSPDSRTRTVV